MKCECGDDFRQFWKDEDFIWLCRTCGRATWGNGCEVYVSRQAERHARLLEACEAALRYDDSIAGKAARGEAKLTDSGYACSNAEDLDALYLDWITKARAALADTPTEGAKP